MTSNCNLLVASAKGDLEEMARIIRDHPEELNKQGLFDKAPLHYPSYLGFPEAVNLLLEYPKILVNIKDKDGITPLMLAAMAGHTNIVMKLLDHPDIRVNEANNFGWTALIYAALHGSTDVVKELLKHPFVDAVAMDLKGRTALDYAGDKGHVEIWRLLKEVLDGIQGIYSVFQLLAAAKDGDEAFVNKFVTGATRHSSSSNSNAADPSVVVNHGDADGFTALHLASLKGHVCIVEKLLELPAIDVNRVEAKHGRTALMFASACGHLSVVKKLMDHPKINVSNVDCEGRSAFFIASKSGHNEVAEYLTCESKGFDV